MLLHFTTYYPVVVIALIASCLLQWYKAMYNMLLDTRKAQGRVMDDYAYFRTVLTASIRRTEKSLAQQGITPVLPAVGRSEVDKLALQRLLSLAAYKLSFVPFAVYTEENFDKVAEGMANFCNDMFLLVFVCRAGLRYGVSLFMRSCHPADVAVGEHWAGGHLCEPAAAGRGLRRHAEGAYDAGQIPELQHEERHFFVGRAVQVGSEQRGLHGEGPDA